MPLRKSVLNTFCGFKDVSSVFSFPCHPSRRGWVEPGSLAVASWRKDTGPRASCQGPVYSVPSGKLGLYWWCLCKVCFSPFSKKPVSATPAQKAVWPRSHSLSPQMSSHESTSQVLTGWEASAANCLARHRWMFNQGPSTKASGRLELLLERLERT